MAGPVELKPPPEAERDDSPSDLGTATVAQIAPEPQSISHDPYRISAAALNGRSAGYRTFWTIVDKLLQILFRSIDFATYVRHRLAADSSESGRMVDAAHPTLAWHRFKPSGGIEAQYWIFIPVEDPVRLEFAADLVLRHLRNWRTFYRRSHIEFLHPEPDPSANTAVTFKFAPLAPWGRKYTGHEVTRVTVSFGPRERLKDGNGWVIKGALIEGFDDNGQPFPHQFTGPVQTEVRIVNDPPRQDRAARVGIEVRDIWVDIRNHKPICDFVGTRMHLFRSADGFGGLRQIMARELKSSPQRRRA